MMRQGSSRSQRSKGLRLKNILQICILAAVFFWLLYQLKHSYAKKKGLDERRSRILNNIFENQSEFVSLGRKDLPRDKVMVSSDNTNEEDENEDGESQRLVEDDEAKGTVDDGFDEQDDQEGGDDEVDDREEIVIEEKDDQVEEADFLDDQEGEDGSSSGTREKSYKKDDASSAVPQESQVQTEGNSVDKENLQNNENDVNTKGDNSARNHTPTDNNSTRSIVVTVGVWNDTIQNQSLGVADGQIMLEFSPPNDQSKLQANSTIARTSDEQMNMQTYLTTDATTIGETQGNLSIMSLENGTLAKSSDDDQNTRVILASPEEDKTSLKSIVEQYPNRPTTITGQETLDESSTASLALDDNGDAVDGDSASASRKPVIEQANEPQIDQSTLPDMQNNANNMDEETAD